MNANQNLTLSNIKAQVRELLGVWVKVKFEDEEIDSTFGTSIRFDNGKYSPEICRFYWDEIEEVDEQELISAYAIAFGSISDKFLSMKGEDTCYIFLGRGEGIFELNPNTWYKQPKQRNGVRVEISSSYDLVSVNHASSWFFKPTEKVKVKVSKELVWGIQTDDNWNFHSSWMQYPNVNPDYDEYTSDDERCYAKQEEIWKAEIVS